MSNYNDWLAKIKKMNNFYEESQDYIELEKELKDIDYSFSRRLQAVVGDAIQYGISVLEKKLKEK